MTAHFEREETASIRQRKRAQMLIPLGAVLVAAGIVGSILALVLKVAWLGLLGGPVGALSWIAMLVGGACLLVGALSLVNASRGGRT